MKRLAIAVVLSLLTVEAHAQLYFGPNNILVAGSLTKTQTGNNITLTASGSGGGLSNIAAYTILGNSTSASALPTAVGLGSGISFSGSNIVASGSSFTANPPMYIYGSVLNLGNTATSTLNLGGTNLFTSGAGTLGSVYHTGIAANNLVYENASQQIALLIAGSNISLNGGTLNAGTAPFGTGAYATIANYVPYTGASSPVNLGSQYLTTTGTGNFGGLLKSGSFALGSGSLTIDGSGDITAFNAVAVEIMPTIQSVAATPLYLISGDGIATGSSVTISNSANGGGIQFQAGSVGSLNFAGTGGSVFAQPIIVEGNAQEPTPTLDFLSQTSGSVGLSSTGSTLIVTPSANGLSTLAVAYSNGTSVLSLGSTKGGGSLQHAGTSSAYGYTTIWQNSSAQLVITPSANSTTKPVFNISNVAGTINFQVDTSGNIPTVNNITSALGNLNFSSGSLTGGFLGIGTSGTAATIDGVGDIFASGSINAYQGGSGTVSLGNSGSLTLIGSSNGTHTIILAPIYNSGLGAVITENDGGGWTYGVSSGSSGSNLCSVKVNGLVVSNKVECQVSGGTVAWNLSNGNVQHARLTNGAAGQTGGVSYVKISGTPVDGTRYTLVLQQPSGATATVASAAWVISPAISGISTINWSNQTAPTLTATAGARDIISGLWCSDETGTFQLDAIGSLNY